jgi:uncharacterized membrane protein SpoIIM required for sporulation
VRQQFFEEQGAPRWRELVEILDGLDARVPVDTSAFPLLYRQLCQDLALARDRQFGGQLIDRLNGLALRGHQWLYQARVRSSSRALDFLARDFPRAVRAEWRIFGFMALLFVGSGLSLLGLLQANPDLVHSFIGPERLGELEAMYEPGAPHIGAPRRYDDQVMMFGYYILNNVGIAFRTFASGLIFGLGSLFFVAFNGIFLGLVAGHLTNLGYGATFYPFVIGHASLELTAIVLSGVAGTKLGMALLSPGPRSRIQALRGSMQRSILILYGAAAMLFVAAIVEAFWSSNALFAAPTKYGVGIVLWIIVGTYLLAAGRGNGD